MTYEDGSSKNELEFNNSIIIIAEILERETQKNKTVLIIGDFNADPINSERTNTKFSLILKDMVNKQKLIFADAIYTQRLRNTFEKNNNKSWIDHVITQSNNRTIEQVNILPKINTTNRSGHLAINVITQVETLPITNQIPKTDDLKIIINYLNPK